MKTKGIGTPAVVVIIVIVAIAGIGGYFVLKGGAKAEFEVTSFTLSSTEASVGESTTGTIKVKNVGDVEGTCTLVVKLNGVETYTQEVTLQLGEEREIPITITWNEAGIHTLETGGLSRTVTVGTPLSAQFEVSNLVFNPSEVEVGEPVVISATVKNVGDLEGTCTVELKIDGVIEATENVTLAGGAVTAPVAAPVNANKLETVEP